MEFRLQAARRREPAEAGTPNQDASRPRGPGQPRRRPERRSVTGFACANCDPCDFSLCFGQCGFDHALSRLQAGAPSGGPFGSCGGKIRRDGDGFAVANPKGVLSFHPAFACHALRFETNRAPAQTGFNGTPAGGQKHGCNGGGNRNDGRCGFMGGFYRQRIPHF